MRADRRPRGASATELEKIRAVEAPDPLAELERNLGELRSRRLRAGKTGLSQRRRGAALPLLDPHLQGEAIREPRSRTRADAERWTSSGRLAASPCRRGPVIHPKTLVRVPPGATMPALADIRAKCRPAALDPETFRPAVKPAATMVTFLGLTKTISRGTIYPCSTHCTPKRKTTMKDKP